MEEILETKLLELGKSTYLIDKVSIDESKPFIRITQTIQQEYNSPLVHSIMLKQGITAEIIDVLAQFSELKVSFQAGVEHKNRLSKICSAYLKGVEIEILSDIYDMPKKEVIQILTNNGLVITGQKVPKGRWRRNRRRRLD